jgi:hypothetical protein
VVVDLKAGRFTDADANQMHLYLDYAREHWMRAGENPPVGLILCAADGTGVAYYALENLENRALAAQYLTVLPKVERLSEELARSQRILETQREIAPTLRSRRMPTGSPMEGDGPSPSELSRRYSS